MHDETTLNYLVFKEDKKNSFVILAQEFFRQGDQVYSIVNLCLGLLIPQWELRNEEFENEEFLATKTDEKNKKMREKNQTFWKLLEEEIIENSK